MEQLLQQQEKNLEEIDQLISNYKKDGAPRKTKTYLEKKIAALKASYSKYVECDEKIRAFQPTLESNHQYYNDRQRASEVYAKNIDEMRQRLNHTSLPSTPTMNSLEYNYPDKTNAQPKTTEQQTEKSNISSTLNQLLRRQEFKMRELYREIENAKDLLCHRKGKQSMQFSLQYMKRAMDQIIDRHEELCVEASDDQQEMLGYFTRDDFENLKQEYTNAAVQLTTAVEQTTSNDGTEIEIKLKPIEIPTFYGDYMKWGSFSEIFQRLIDQNSRLSDTHKINYLKNHVSGAAAKLICHLESTGDNYETAWSILKNRFNNKRLLVSAYLSTLLNQPSINAESSTAIRNLHDTTNECLHSIKRLGIDVESWNSFLIYILLKKLDSETRRLYESSLKNPCEFQETNEFLKFLEQRFKSLEASNTNRSHPLQQQKMQALKHTFVATAQHSICIFCQMDHTIDRCLKFKQLSVIEKSQIALLHKLCRRCLSSAHQTYDCKQNTRCIICNGNHHTTLHTPRPQQQIANSSDVKSFKLVSTVNQYNEHVLLATAMVRATNHRGNYTTLRVLIDPGSQATFITEEAMQRLKLKGLKIHAKIAGVGDKNIGEVNKTVNLKIQSITTSKFEMELDALVFQKLTKLLPEQQVETKGWEHLNHLNHADPNYSKPGPIDMLLGADGYSKIVLSEIIKGNEDQPVAQNTELGWIVFGKFKTSNCKNAQINSMTSYIDLEKQLKKFWEIEEVEVERELTNDEQRCEQHFQSTHKRLDNGAYQIALPFKSNDVKLGESKKKATARLLQVEKQLSKNPEMKNEYTNFIEEYIKLNHMEKINRYDNLEKGYFLPHHASKYESSTTKLRVVFDASAKTSNGLSLNDLMHTGPTIQQQLVDILLRWRKHKYVFKADIEKMFRQIRMRPQDQIYQLLLWRNKTGAIDTYKLKTVTYGTSSATYLATRVLHQLAQDDGDQYPAVKRALIEDFYVDDLLSGANTIEKAAIMQEQVSKLLRQGGFNLRKWSSNNQKILQSIHTDHMSKDNHQIEIGETIKTLGIIWNPMEDIFQFRIKLLDIKRPITKRKVLSETSKLFDPMGWLAPVIIKAKITIQHLWALGLDWDKQLPNDLEENWISFVNQLQTLENIRLQRWITHDTDNVGELHGFCDASEDAYAAVIYYKSSTTVNQNKVTLVVAKTKVAPLKAKLTIPRLELCAAVLLSRLMRKTVQALQEPNIKTFAWTDSMITLGWIKGKPNRFKTFVANRIVEIQSIIPPLQWKYVKSEENPADCASRGLNAQKLIEHPLWWSGPRWLKHSEEYAQQPLIEETIQECRKELCVATTTTNSKNEILELIERCSSFTKAVRSITYVLRFAKRTTKSSRSYLTTKELHDSLILALKITQQHFGISDKQLDKLQALNPIINNDGLFCVGGRLSNARTNFDTKHPIIIPYKSQLTRLLIDYAHKMTLHGGKSLTLAFIRQKYWIIKGPLAVKTFINRCVICHKQQARTMNQLMGDLPTARITPTRPFTHTGVDYAGPFQLRYAPGRGQKSYKGYLAVFICFAVKAVHIEVVSDLSSEAFIAAFKRFTARRGHCSDIYSDCGTNFIGASKLMRTDLSVALKQLPEKLAEQLAKDGMQFHNIPPRAPHMGGLWEAAVKSVKHHLRRIIGEQRLTFEEMTTVTCQIEACLNSRPLFPLTSDPNDLTTLTPGHFLIGEPLRTIPEPNILDQNINHLGRWRLLQRITQEYWKIWRTEYMLLLQKRSKWNKKEPNITKGELVLVKDDDLPPGKWPLGRVHEVHSGNDGLVRTVTIKNSHGGLIKRPITKISRIPMEDNERETVSLPNEEPPTTSGCKVTPNQHGRATRASTNSKLLLHSLTIICALGVIMAETPARFNITRFNYHPGIYLDKTGEGKLINGEWKIITFYNITSYWAELKYLGDGARQMDKQCSDKTLIEAGYTSAFKYCEAIVLQIKSLHEQLEEQNEILNTLSENKITRKRRAPFDFIGTVSNELFGVLDQRAGNTYKEAIEKLNANQQHHKELLQQQVSILESTVNLIKHNDEETRQKFETYNQILATILFHEEFTDLAIHTILEMMRLRDFQAAVINTITEVHQGRLDPLILTPHQLQEQIKEIIPNLKLSQDMPFRGNNMAAIYKVATIKTIKIDEMIIFEIKIPLVQRTKYNIYQVIPVPTIHQEELVYIKPSSTFLLIAIQENQYTQLSWDELNTCTNLNGEYLCDVHQPLKAYNSNTSSCEIQLMKNTGEIPLNCEIHRMAITTQWIPLRRYNAWIFVMESKAQYELICERDSSGTIEATTISIAGEGILTLDPTCVLKGDTTTLTGYRTVSSKFELSYIPQFNLSSKLKLNHTTIKSPSSQATRSHIQTIEDSIQNHKRQLETSTTELNIHDVHHYTISYTIIGILLSAGVIMIYFKCKGKPKTAELNPACSLPSP